eukprot:GHVL01036199.1.p1 GENE.GHVL01036199.1~~GHVL01036199.1.p1  ORF type:complete len:120 (-),score=9.23 GHVL01036199.1:361-720(-)
MILFKNNQFILSNFIQLILPQDVLRTSVNLAFRYKSHEMIACGMAVLLESRGPAIKLKLFDEWYSLIFYGVFMLKSRFKAFKLCDLANLIGVPAIKFIELQELIIFFIRKQIEFFFSFA